MQSEESEKIPKKTSFGSKRSVDGASIFLFIFVYREYLNRKRKKKARGGRKGWQEWQRRVKEGNNRSRNIWSGAVKPFCLFEKSLVEHLYTL